MAVCRRARLTPDIQVIGPSQQQQHVALGTGASIGTATVVAARLQLIF